MNKMLWKLFVCLAFLTCSKCGRFGKYHPNAMKKLIVMFTLGFLCASSALAQYLNVQWVSPQDGSRVHGATFETVCEVTYAGENPMSETQIEGYADGQLYFIGVIYGSETPYVTLVSAPYQTNVRGPHVFTVIVYDSITFSSDAMTLYR